MEWENLKKPNEAALDGISINVERIDGSVRVVTLDDGAGHRIRLSSDRGLTMAVPAKPKMVTRWVVQGTVCGIRVAETHEQEHEAESRRASFVEMINGAFGKSGDGVKMERTEVPE